MPDTPKTDIPIIPIIIGPPIIDGPVDPPIIDIPTKDEVKDKIIDVLDSNPDTTAEQVLLLASMKRTINQAGGISNIGMLDDYWVQLRRYNFLQSQDKDKFSKSGGDK